MIELFLIIALLISLWWLWCVYITAGTLAELMKDKGIKLDEEEMDKYIRKVIDDILRGKKGGEIGNE
ncbi:MAG: hypothetical protein HFI11_07930 [Lachnospiraceae bacterium]|nr:hypothetical protein [Lachnospiraceae bacterium]